MTPLSNNNHKLILENKLRIAQLGVHGHERVQYLLKLCSSRLNNGKIALGAAQQLSEYLNKHEAKKALEPESHQVPKLTKGFSMSVGSTVDDQEYRLSKDDLTLPIIIAGSSGSGKSTAIAHFILQLTKAFEVTFFDHKDEGSRFLNLINDALYIPFENQRWNLCKGYGDQSSYVRFVASHLSRMASLQPVTSNAVQAKLLNLCHDKNDLPSLADLAQIFNNLAFRDKRSNLLTASRALEDIAMVLGDWARVRKGISPFQDAPLCVLPLKDVAHSTENFILTLFYKNLMDAISVDGHKSALKRVLVFDEGRGFWGKEFEAGSGAGRINVQTEIATKSRSYGLLNVVATQSAHMLQGTLIDNAGTFIALRSNSETEAKFICRKFGWDDSRYREIMELGVGEAFITSPRCVKPTRVRIPYVDLGNYLSEQEVRDAMQAKLNEWNALCTFRPIPEDKAEKVDYRTLLVNDSPQTAKTTSQSPEPTQATTAQPAFSRAPIIVDHVAFVEACHLNPNAGSTDIYNILGFSAAKGNRIKKQVIAAHFVTIHRVKSPSGGRPKETFILTEKGKELINA